MEREDVAVSIVSVTASHNLRDCMSDLVKILDATGIKYELINLSPTGRAKADNWLVIDDIKNYL